jgi:hypothetical protein
MVALIAENMVKAQEIGWSRLKSMTLRLMCKPVKNSSSAELLRINLTRESSSRLQYSIATPKSCGLSIHATHTE